MLRRWFLASGTAAGLVGIGARAFAQADPLPSWNDGEPKRAVLDFVSRTTAAGGPDFVPVEQRIAVFDNDGTLWAEQPVYFQLAFAFDRVKALAPQHPEWKEREPFKSVLADDMAGLAATGRDGLLEILAATQTGTTTEEFGRIVSEWITTAPHPRFKRPHVELVYQPMLELLAFLRANQFKTFIVSGGGIEFMRPWTEKVYGIPPEQVIGSYGTVEFKLRDGAPALLNMSAFDFVNDGPTKPVGIDRFIGRRPILAFGNSDGDLQMLQYTAGGDGLRLMGLVHHTDAVREYAYDRDSRIGRLDKALDEAQQRKWTVVDMKADWNTIFPFERK